MKNEVNRAFTAKKKTLLLMIACVCACMLNARTINLSDLPASSDTYGMKTISNGDTVTGTLRGQLYPYKLMIPNNATVYLKSVTIYGHNDASYPFAGITCLGNAHIVLIGSNFVQGFYDDYPGIQASTNTNQTLRISGTGSLDVRCGGTENPNTGVLQGYAAAIGGSANDNCGDIVIEGGTINAYSGSASAAIGGGSYHECGMITISGGNITTHPGYNNSTGIGASFHGECDKITISGGTIYAEGNGHGAAIGGNEQSTTYGIEITSGLVYITALNESYNPNTGFGAPYTIGKGLNGTGSTVEIAGISLGDGIAENPFVYPQPCTTPTNVQVTNITGTSAKISWTPGSVFQQKFVIAINGGDYSSTRYIQNVTANPYTLTGLTAGKSYTVQVRAVCSNDEYSGFSTAVEFETTCPAPSNLQIPDYKVTSSSAIVSWSGSADKYLLEYGIVGQTQTLGVEVFGTTKELSGLQSNTQYRARVHSVCSDTNVSEDTQWVNFTTAEYTNPCAAPSDLKINNITLNSASLRWTKGNPSQNSFTVSYKKSSESEYTDMYASNNYANLSGLEENTSYDVRIVANCGSDGTSDPLTGSFTTLAPEPVEECKAPEDIYTGVVTATTAWIFWFPQNGEKKWNLVYKRSSNSNYIDVTVTDFEGYQLVNLEPNTSYDVNVYAICSDDSWSPWYNDGIDFTFKTANSEGIDEINAAGKATKIIRDGQLLILVGDKTYDAQGNELR